MEHLEDDEKTDILKNGDKTVTEKSFAANHNACSLDRSKSNFTFRSTLAQWLATIANSMMFLGVGMMVAVPTIVIGVLHNSKSGLSLNDTETSWFGSLMLLIQPLGCVIASFLQHYIGRKTGMILMNIPELISWLILYTANSVNLLYISAAVMGLSAGFMEAPGLSYIGEIAEPRIRGMLTSFANINVCIGMMIEFFLGSIFDWRTAVAISAFFPALAIVLISCIPDSPVWLLDKNRKQDALHALCWLRGWVSEDKVKAEFEELCRYTDAAKFLKITDTKNQIYAELSSSKSYVCANGKGIVKSPKKKSGQKMKISHLYRTSMLKPFRLIIGYEFFSHCAMLSSIRSYMVEVFNTLNMPVEPQWLVFGTGVVMLVGGVTCILTVKYLGKRLLSLISMTMSSLGCIILGAYTLYKDEIQLPCIPMITFCILYFSTTIGISPIPWMLISEVFPVRGRSFGAGFSAAMFYIIAFLFSKTYLDIERIIHMSGCFFLYGIFGFVGVIFLYVYLPETEGKTLAEVENFFSKNPKKSTIY